MKALGVFVGGFHLTRQNFLFMLPPFREQREESHYGQLIKSKMWSGIYIVIH